MSNKLQKKKPDDVCGACQQRRDQHNSRVPCPLFVERTWVPQQPTAIEAQMIKAYEVLMADDANMNAGWYAGIDRLTAGIWEIPSVAPGSKTVAAVRAAATAESRPAGLPTTSREFYERVEQVVASALRGFDPQSQVLGAIKRLEHLVANLEAQLDAKARAVQALQQRVDGLEKQLGQAASFDPQVQRAFKDRYPYGIAISDEEELLEEGYRGWPKPRVRF